MAHTAGPGWSRWPSPVPSSATGRGVCPGPSTTRGHHGQRPGRRGPASWQPPTVPPADSWQLRACEGLRRTRAVTQPRGHGGSSRREGRARVSRPRCPAVTAWRPPLRAAAVSCLRPAGGSGGQGWHVCATCHPPHPSGHHSWLLGVPVALLEVADWRQDTYRGFAACAAGSGPTQPRAWAPGAGSGTAPSAPQAPGPARRPRLLLRHPPGRGHCTREASPLWKLQML